MIPRNPSVHRIRSLLIFRIDYLPVCDYLLTAFYAVFGTTLFAAFYAERIECATHDMVSYAWEVTDSATADEDD